MAAITTVSAKLDLTAPSLVAAVCIVLLGQRLAAAPLDMPAGAVQIGKRAEAPVSYALPIARFDGTTVPTQIVTGSLDQTAWRIDGFQGNTQSLLQPLSDQLAAQGYHVVFTCQTTQCGGFDFRFGIDILPEPQMHVDLGDYLYLAALNTPGDAVSLLVSRTAEQGFLQVTSVSTNAALRATPPKKDPGPAIESAPKIDSAVPQAQPQIPSQPAPAAVQDMAATLTGSGAVALDDLVFASGKAVLEERDYPSLAALAEWLKANPTLKVTLVGHTDASGSLAANVVLSKQRAASVRAWLVKHYGAAGAQIDAQGAGYLSPRASNQTPEGRTQNRRVEVMLTSSPQN